MSEIKAIETVYNGYKFRSRLEARWAVFFDAAGIKYEYEPQGFELSDGTKYLPDFYLKDYNMYAEVKPFDLDRVDEIIRTFKFIERNGPISKIIYLPEIPEIREDTNEYWYLCIYWSDLFDSAVLQRIPIYDIERDTGNKVDIFPAKSWRDSGATFYPCINVYGREQDLKALKALKYWEAVHVSRIQTRTKIIFDYYIQETKLTTIAYKIAKQARFEHGECG